MTSWKIRGSTTKKSNKPTWVEDDILFLVL